MSTTTEVTQKDLHDLLEIFERKPFDAGSCEEGSLEEDITNRCELLFKQDYTLIELDNSNGILSPRYPGRIFIPEYEHGHMTSTITANNTSLGTQATNHASPQNSNNGNGLPHNPPSPSPSNSTESDSTTPSTSSGIQSFVTFANSATNEQQQTSYPLYYQHHFPPPQHPIASTSNSISNNTANNTIYEDLYDVNKVRELITMAKYARCRQRFAVPVIMYRGKYICRSATISINAETYGRKAVDYAYDCINGTNYSERANHVADDENNDNGEDSLMNPSLNGQSPFSYEEVIKSDIQLLNTLNVTTIIDLMVEKRKIKYFMAVSSSEKADPENHYESFNLLSLPYPGCEFFKKFRDNNYMAEGLHYNWKLSFNDAPLNVPEAGPLTELNIDWSDYKNWDLVCITQNYVKACLRYIKDEKSGLLIHCISGWDRTPLFISLIRLSLWADGLIHQSLNPFQMAYFTIAYDWYLFGHQLPDRLKRGEDIMFFCFHVLKYITGEEFSIADQRRRTKTSSSSGSSIVVLKCDSGDESASLKESMLFDQDSNESFNNGSNCDNLSVTDGYYAPVPAPSTSTTAAATAQGSSVVGNNPLTNRSPNLKRSKTSPISVPGASATRQRHESYSSTGGSWQVVTVTGSIDSMPNGSLTKRMAEQRENSDNRDNSGNSENSGNSGSNTASTSKEEAASSSKPPETPRLQRLNAVRAIFIQAYGKQIGLKFKEGSSTNLASFIGTISDQFF